MAGCEIRACESNDALACARLAEQLVRGDVIGRDVERAHVLRTRACEAGVAWSCYSLSMARSQSGWFAQHASPYLGQACDADILDACYELGLLLSESKDETEWAEAIEILHGACDLGHGSSCNDLGVLYAKGRVVPQNRIRSVALYRRACDLDELLGCENLAVRYYDGDHVEQDVARAVLILGDACQRGHGDACRLLGDWRYDEGGPVHEPRRGFASYEAGCESGHRLSCAKVAWRLLHSDAPEVERDIERGLALAESACDDGNAWSCNKLAEWLDYQEGPVFDPERATMAWKKGCDLYDEDACSNYLRRRLEGEATDEQQARALEEAGVVCLLHQQAEACLIASRAYDRGIGTKVDTDQSVWMLNLGCGYSSGEATAEACRQLATRAQESPGNEMILGGLLIGCEVHPDLCDATRLYSKTLEPVDGWQSTCEDGNSRACIVDVIAETPSTGRNDFDSISCTMEESAACATLAVALTSRRIGVRDVSAAKRLVHRYCAMSPRRPICDMMMMSWAFVGDESRLAFLRPLGHAASREE